MKTRVTSTQPEVAKTRIYGSRKVEPLAGASNQPEVLPNTRVYGSKKTRQIRVTLKGGTKEVLIRESDFDPTHHEPVDA